MTFDFRGASVFVAGGTSGINLGIAECYARAGAKVAVMSRNAERVEQAAARLSAFGGQVLGTVGDVRDMAQVIEAMQQAHAVFGAFDVLVSGAAGNFLCPALDLSSNGFKVVVDIDLVGTFHVMRAGFNFARKPGASFINISAPQSTFPSPMQVHACAAKAGLDQVMRVLALEWGEYGIRVNSISPGPIRDTGGIGKFINPHDVERIVSRIPLRRMGTAEEIGQMALFLGSPLAGYITGAFIPVDGGTGLLGGRNYAGDPIPTPRNTEANSERVGA